MCLPSGSGRYFLTVLTLVAGVEVMVGEGASSVPPPRPDPISLKKLQVTSLGFSRDGLEFVTTTLDGHLLVWDTKTGRELRRFGPAFGPGKLSLGDMELTRDGKHIFAVQGSARVVVWDIKTLKEFTRFEREKDTITALALSNDGKQLLTAGNGCIRVWDTANRNIKSTIQVRFFSDHPSMRAMALSHDGQYLAVALGGFSDLRDSPVMIWSITTGKFLRGVGKDLWAQAVAFSPTQHLLGSTGDDEKVRLWNPKSGEEIAVLSDHRSPTHALAFSRDGSLLASGDEEGIVKIWEVASKQCLRTIIAHTNPVTALEFTPDGKLLASGSERGRQVRLWITRSGAPLQFQPEKAPEKPEKPRRENGSGPERH
jgi:WD40 repeat protein